MNKTYTITPNIGFFDELNTLITATAALTIACELSVPGKSNQATDNYLTIECLRANARVRLPIADPISAVLADRRLDIIYVSVLDGRNEEPEYFHQSARFASLMDALFQPFVIHYYERHVGDIRMRHSENRAVWPPAWQMGWMVRNAVSHGGCVHFTDPTQRPVRWAGLEVSPREQGARILGSILNYGDLILLMFSMEESRARQIPSLSA
jgi:hypothetical protein